MKPYILIILILAFLFLGYAFCLPRPSSQTENFKMGIPSEWNKPTPMPKTQTVYDLQKDSVEYNAAMLVGLDDGGRLPDLSDGRIKRVADLLTEISNHTTETITEISAATDSTADFIKNQYSKTISRQQLLEDAKMMFMLSDKKAMKGQKFKDLLRLWALMKYGN